MASYKVVTTTFSCPNCRRELFKTENAAVHVGKPFMHCRVCDIYIPNQYSQEWYCFRGKWSFYLLPVIFFLISLITALVCKAPGTPSLLIGCFGFLIGLIVMLCQLPRITASKKRMRSKEYLNLLNSLNLIAPEDYRSFCEKADLP